MTDPEVKGDVASALSAGKLIARLEQSPGHLVEDARPYLVLPAGLSVVDVERLLPYPQTLRALVLLREPGSLIQYVQQFATPATALFADLDTHTITAVLDYHAAAIAADDAASAREARPQWGQHRAQLRLVVTPAWQAWTAINGRKISQTDAAEFLDQHLPEIADPAGARLLEVVRSLDATRATNFRSAVRLDNGAHQFTYEDTVEAKSGTLDVPATITLGIAPFLGVPSYGVPVRLRYRLDDRRLSFVFVLLRPEAIVEDAFRGVCDLVGRAVGSPLYAGAAPTGMADSLVFK